MLQPLEGTAELAVKYVNTTNRNIFLTGKAGSGKTTLLHHIVNNTYKNSVVAAPTGIAAINAGGVTLHSLLQLPFGAFIPENHSLPSSNLALHTPRSVLSKFQMSASKREVLKEMELLIIDEVSMLRADLLDCIDHILRHVRKKRNYPFGGVQVLFIGDLNQLPPVVNQQEWQVLSGFYPSIFFFDAHVLQQEKPVYIELNKIYRQSDERFVGLLNRLRENELSHEDVLNLNKFYKKGFSPSPEEGYIHITTHNKKSDQINQIELEKLDAQPFSYTAEIAGHFPENLYPLPEKIIFKEGAQVMFIKNDPAGEGRFYNGQIGQVYTLRDDTIDIKLRDTGEIVHLKPYKWENKKYELNKSTNEIEEEVVGTFEQYPLRLAWSITVHKSQGLTFEKAILDLHKTFAPGQMYVALSRLTSLEGLVLSSPIPSSLLEPDAALKEFGNSKAEEELLQKRLEEDKKAFAQKVAVEIFDFSDLLYELKIHLTSFDKDELRSEKQQYKEWTFNLQNHLVDLQDIAQKYERHLLKTLSRNEANFFEILYERIEKALEYYDKELSEVIEKVKEHRKEIGMKKQVKTYSREVRDIENQLHAKVQKITKGVQLVKSLCREEIPSKKTLRVHKEVAVSTKKAVGATVDHTLKLYREGRRIEEIAEIRDLTSNTIEGHLAKCVANGDVDAKELISGSKLDQIIKVAKMLESDKLGDIKPKLGDEFSYGMIRIAIAHQKYMEKSKSPAD